MDAEEPRYIQPGNEFGDGPIDRMPKWRKPAGDFQCGLFRVTHRKYWPEGPEGKGLRSQYIELERSMMSLDSGVVARYPTEWVKNCFDWAEEQNHKAGYGKIGLKAILSLVANIDQRDRFIRRYQGGKENGRADRWD